MKHQNKIKWKIKDYVRTTLLYVGQALFISLLFILALLIETKGLNGLNTFLNDSDNVKECIYVLIANTLLMAVIYLYFIVEEKDFLYQTSKNLMFFAIISVSLIACFFIGKINVYLRPFAMCALLSLLLIGKRPALFINCIFCFLMFLCDLFVTLHTENIRYLYVSLIINFISGVFAVYTVDGEGSRAKVLIHGLLISIPVVISAISLEYASAVNVLLLSVIYALLSGLVSVSLLMLLLPFFEILYGALTNFRLAELTDHKAKLIKRMIKYAPGTFNHTIIVASLAESCSNAIGENPLLARACAYYHDIGKMKKADFFTENQSGRNPHDELSPELSTDIIRAHAKDGAQLIKSLRLPQVLADAAEQHHGTMPIRYFYAKAMKFTDEELDIEDYSYYGPKPQTKINAILMICDACEAKVRTVSNRTHENVDKAVKEIIEERMDMEQFTECDITFRELDVIRNAITNTLAGVYHARIKYPKLKTGNKNEN